MSGTNDELDVAHEALTRARDDLLRQLEDEPAWRALKRLDARNALAEGVDLQAVRTGLVVSLDAAIPEWRTLADIEAAIVALGTGQRRSQPPSRPELPPPIPASSISRAPAPTERTRFSSQSRPAAIAPPSNGRGRPPIVVAQQSRLPVAQPPEPSQRSKSVGGRLAVALGLVGDGPARLSEIETEVERLVRRDAEAWEEPSAGRPARSLRPARPLPLPPPPSPSVAPLPGEGEAAEVEIVFLSPAPRSDEQRPITRLADRLTRAGDRAPDGRMEPIVSMHAHLEEADIEIDLGSEPSATTSASATAARSDKDATDP